ncbi:MAG: hypothetical protein KGI56_09640 [Acidobacteriota bacterium]|nr:hypothetical protein [Acidobacteriota bacterium]
MLFLPPAQIQAAPVPARPLHGILEALENLPEAITDRRPGRVAHDAAGAARVWSRTKDALMPHVAPGDQPALAKAMAGLRAKDPHTAALAALDAQDLLLKLVPAGRDHELRRADQDGMRAWIQVDLGHWDAVPDLEAAFAWLRTHDEGRHTRAVADVTRELAAFDAARKARQGAPALRAAQRLLDLVDVLERP